MWPIHYNAGRYRPSSGTLEPRVVDRTVTFQLRDVKKWLLDSISMIVVCSACPQPSGHQGREPGYTEAFERHPTDALCSPHHATQHAGAHNDSPRSPISSTVMSTIANETADDPTFKKFMHSFNGYLIAQMILRQYDAPKRRRSRITGVIAPGLKRIRTGSGRG